MNETSRKIYGMFFRRFILNKNTKYETIIGRHYVFSLIFWIFSENFIIIRNTNLKNGITFGVIHFKLCLSKVGVQFEPVNPNWHNLCPKTTRNMGVLQALTI